MSERIVLDRDDLRRTLVRIAHEIIEKNPGGEDLAIVGIHTRGAIIGRRLHALITELSGAEIPLGDVDISFYRDDVDLQDPREAPVVEASHLDFDPTGLTIVLADDVLFTGRTVRAAIDVLFDYVGKNLPTAFEERVNVQLEEVDGIDEVTIGVTRSPATLGGEQG